MSKTEALQAVTAEGSIGRFGRSPAWDKAFNAYNEAHPNDKKSMNCGNCYRQVLKWMQG